MKFSKDTLEKAKFIRDLMPSLDTADRETVSKALSYLQEVTQCLREVYGCQGSDIRAYGARMSSRLSKLSRG